MVQPCSAIHKIMQIGGREDQDSWPLQLAQKSLNEFPKAGTLIYSILLALGVCGVYCVPSLASGRLLLLTKDPCRRFSQLEHIL